CYPSVPTHVLCANTDFHMQLAAAHRHQLSFPTRRSSDLCGFSPSARASRCRANRSSTACGGSTGSVTRQRTPTRRRGSVGATARSEEHTSERQPPDQLICRPPHETKNGRNRPLTLQICVS